MHGGVRHLHGSLRAQERASPDPRPPRVPTDAPPSLATATMFLKIWKQQRASVVLVPTRTRPALHSPQENIALELINCPSYKLWLHKHFYLRSTVILILTLLMVCRGCRGGDGDRLHALCDPLPAPMPLIGPTFPHPPHWCPPCPRASLLPVGSPPIPVPSLAPAPTADIPQISLMISMVHVLVVYRVLASMLFSSLVLPFLEELVTTAMVETGALVHYVTIVIMTNINKLVALKFCDFGERMTHTLLGDPAGGLRAGALELWSETGEGTLPTVPRALP
ncbi:Anoctamin-9 [Plecturocebus cupreus]